MKTLLVAWTVALTAIPSVSYGQSQIVNAQVETRQLTRALGAEIEAVANQHDPGWIAYQVATVRGPQHMCDANPGVQTKVMLEPATELVVLVRVSGKQIERVKTVTPECEIDAGGLPVVWLNGVTSTQSAQWLTQQIAATSAGAQKPKIALAALAGLIWHQGEQPVRTIVDLAKNDPRPIVRGQALFWLAQRAGDQVVDTIRGAVDNDPETEVKRKAVFALSQLPKDQGVPLLLDVAQHNQNREVRKQAMFWLGQSKDPRAIAFFEQLLK